MADSHWWCTGTGRGSGGVHNGGLVEIGRGDRHGVLFLDVFRRVTALRFSSGFTASLFTDVDGASLADVDLFSQPSLNG